MLFRSGSATFGLVRARWAIGAHDGLAELLAQADAHFAAIGDAGERRKIADWSREHPSPPPASTSP